MELFFMVPVVLTGGSLSFRSGTSKLWIRLNTAVVQHVLPSTETAWEFFSLSSFPTNTAVLPLHPRMRPRPELLKKDFEEIIAPSDSYDSLQNVCNSSIFLRELAILGGHVFCQDFSSCGTEQAVQLLKGLIISTWSPSAWRWKRCHHRWGHSRSIQARCSAFSQVISLSPKMSSWVSMKLISERNMSACVGLASTHW